MEEDNHNNSDHNNDHHNGCITNSNGLGTYPHSNLSNGLATYPHDYKSDGDGGINWLPPGFRFHPTDEELVTFYLLQKMRNPNSFTHHPAISEVDLNKCEPWDLPGSKD